MSPVFKPQVLQDKLIFPVPSVTERTREEKAYMWKPCLVDAMTSENDIARVLIKNGLRLFRMPRQPIEFTRIPEANNLLNDLKKHPHFFVLGCIMDRQVKAERAWVIPYRISQIVKSPSFESFLTLRRKQILYVFEKEGLHRFNSTMASLFYRAIETIHTTYHDDASRIWIGAPASAAIVRRFLEFDGVKIKIASMAANILARQFKVPMRDLLCIDVSPDRHVRRVFRRTGLVPEKATNEYLVYRARELYPKYPGVFDMSCFTLGRDVCHVHSPDCRMCYLSPCCPRVGT